MTLITLVVFLIIIGLAFWAIKMISGALSIPPPIVVVIQVFLVIFVVLYLLQSFTGISNFRLR